MARGNTTNDLLERILVDLENMNNARKKGNQGQPQSSNVPKATIGDINIEQSKQASNVLANISQSVNTLSKISEADIKHVQNVLSALTDSLKYLKVNKEDISGLDTVIDSFTKINSIVGGMSKHFVSSMLTFSPLKGKLLGRRLGKFYKNFIGEFAKELAGDDLLTGLKSLGGEKNKGLGENLTGLSNFMQSLFSMDWKKMIKVGIAWKLMPKDAGANVAQFLTPIIEVIDKMPESEVDTVGGGMMVGKDKVHVANKKVAAFLDVFNAISSLSVGQIFKLQLMGIMLGPKLGAKAGGFFSNFIQGINNVGVEETKQARQIINSITVMFGSLTLCLLALTALVAYAKPEHIAGGLIILSTLVLGSIGIIKWLSNKEMKQGAKDSLYTTLSLVLLYTSLTGVLAITTAMVKNNDIKDILGGFAVLGGLVTISMIALSKLGKAEVQQNSKNALLSALAISGLFLAMSAVSLIAVQVGKDFKEAALGSLVVSVLAGVGIHIFNNLAGLKREEITNGLIGIGAITLMMLAMSGISLLAVEIGKNVKEAALGSLVVIALAGVGGFIFKQLSKIDRENVYNGLMVTGGIALVFLILSWTLRDYVVPMLKNMEQIGWGGIIKGLGVTALMVGSLLGITYMLAKSKLNTAEIGKAELVLGGIAAIILLLGTGMDMYGSYLQKIQNVSAKSIAIGTALMVGMVTAVGAAVYAASSLVAGPQAALYAAGVVAIAGIAGVIASISGAMLLFATMIDTINKQLTIASIRKATDMIVGKGENKGLVGCIIDIVNGLDDIGIKAMIKLKVISKNLNPLFLGLSSFVDVIQKMALMKMVDHYDEHGNPVYVPMNPAAFKDAAVNLSVAFGTFLKELNNAFVDGDSAKKMGKIIKHLTKGNIQDLMASLGGFSEAITNFATLKVADKWDSAGRPISYIQLEQTAFKTAATNLADAFSTFLGTLDDRLGDNSKSIKRLIKRLTAKEGGLTSLFTQIKDAMTPLATFSSGLISVNGKIFKTDKETLLKSAHAMVEPISYMLGRMNTLYKAIDYDDINYVCNCIDRMYKTMSKRQFYVVTNDFVKGSRLLLEHINKAAIDQNRINRYVNSLDKVANVFNKIRPIFNSTPKAMNKAAKAIQKLDSVLIRNSANRVKAVNLMAQSFNGLSKSVGDLNAELAKSMNALNDFKAMKEFDDRNFVVNAVQHVGVITESVGKTVAKVREENAENAKKTNERVSSAGISVDNMMNAIVNALNEWNAEHKDLTLELTGEGAIALGTIYGNR